jgi:hypothetical protein
MSHQKISKFEAQDCKHLFSGAPGEGQRTLVFRSVLSFVDVGATFVKIRGRMALIYVSFLPVSA